VLALVGGLAVISYTAITTEPYGVGVRPPQPARIGRAMEAASTMRLEPPQTGQLIAAARARLNQELAQLPPLDSPAFWRTLQGDRGDWIASPGALVHVLRETVSRQDEAASRELFILILRCVAAANAAWAQRAARRVWSVPAEVRRAIEEDLEQEITLHLWERLALRTAETWELFFRRSLDYAQRHVATAYMVRNGYWRDPQAAQPTRGLAILLFQLALRAPDAGSGGSDGTQQIQLHTAELADLRRLVINLPDRERIAVSLRFWQRADEREIAEALGGITTRTVRNILRRAYTLLRARYAGEGGCE
jgi:DNA-directed RNA polymerase specialized sigma24 family protein